MPRACTSAAKASPRHRQPESSNQRRHSVRACSEIGESLKPGSAIPIRSRRVRSTALRWSTSTRRGRFSRVFSQVLRRSRLSGAGRKLGLTWQLACGSWVRERIRRCFVTSRGRLSVLSNEVSGPPRQPQSPRMAATASLAATASVQSSSCPNRQAPNAVSASTAIAATATAPAPSNEPPSRYSEIRL